MQPIHDLTNAAMEFADKRLGWPGQLACPGDLQQRVTGSSSKGFQVKRDFLRRVSSFLCACPRQQPETSAKIGFTSRRLVSKIAGG
jgi:hypothetical protein